MIDLFGKVLLKLNVHGLVLFVSSPLVFKRLQTCAADVVSNRYHLSVLKHDPMKKVQLHSAELNSLLFYGLCCPVLLQPVITFLTSLGGPAASLLSGEQSVIQ